MLQKNDVIEIAIDDIGLNGEGVAHLNDFPIFIPRCIKGEKVRAKVILVKKNYAVAKAYEWLVKSDSRVSPVCSVYARCGGCCLQHVDYGYQLELKRQKITNAFKRVAGINPPVEPCVKSDLIYGYRNKFSIPVRRGVKIGFFAFNSHDTVEIDGCPINFFENGKIIRLLKTFMLEYGLDGYDEKTFLGDIRHVVARRIDGHTAITVVSPREKFDELKKFDELLKREFGGSYALYHNYNRLKNNVILGDKFTLIGGEDREVDVDGLYVKIHPAAFFQVNDSVQKKLYAAIKNEIDGTVIEGYSGTGILTARIAQKADKVISAEISAQAVDSAKKLMTRYGIKNVDCRLGDCSELFADIIKNEKKDGKKITALIDPPRTGASKTVLDAVADADKIIYVSCNPATLARDVKILTESGFEIKKIIPFDMFPNTDNVETLVVLSHKNLTDISA